MSQSTRATSVESTGAFDAGFVSRQNTFLDARSRYGLRAGSEVEDRFAERGRADGARPPEGGGGRAAAADTPQARFAAELGERRVLVLGAARSGVAASRLLLGLGARVTLVDRRAQVFEAPAVRELVQRGLDVYPGGDGPELIGTHDLLVISPGVTLEHPLVVAALRQGVELTGELDLAARLAQAPLCCVTGTNGKSTTVEWIGAMLASAGRRVAVLGNVGRPLSEDVLGFKPQDVLVVEVSSFQLETVRYLSPRVAALLNVAPDHLDRHGTIEAYVRLKLGLFSRQSGGDDAVMPADWQGPAVPGAGRRLSFGLDASQVDAGATVVEGWVVRRGGGAEERLLPVDALALGGPHNVLNALAAIAAVERFAIDADPLRRALQEFVGLPHRLERVLVDGGVSYINDSKATNVHAMGSALESFAGGVHLVAGGRDKDGDFEAVRSAVETRVVRVYRYGEARQRLAAAWPAVPGGDFVTLADAVADAHRRARSGDVVLLAPGCASFDQFRDFEERGETFRQIVRELTGGGDR